MTVNIQSLKRNCERDLSLSVAPRSVHDITACTTFSWGSVGGAIYLCVATADNVVLMRYNYSMENFTIKKVRTNVHPRSLVDVCEYAVSASSVNLCFVFISSSVSLRGM